MSDVYGVRSPAEDGWGPSRSVRSRSAGPSAPPPAAGPGAGPTAGPASDAAAATAAPATTPSAGATAPPARSAEHTTQFPKLPPRSQARRGPRVVAAPPSRAEGARTAAPAGPAPRAAQHDTWDGTDQPAPRRRGLPGWGGVLVMIGVTAVGALVDAARGEQLGTGFNVGIILGAAAAVLLVRRGSMFPVVVAPPLVYALGAGLSLYLRSHGLSDRGVLLDAAANWLVYGFPAIAAASAVVLIIAGVRLIARR